MNSLDAVLQLVQARLESERARLCVYVGWAHKDDAKATRHQYACKVLEELRTEITELKTQ